MIKYEYKGILMSTCRRMKLERKLAILKKGVALHAINSAKDRDERKQFWSEMMDTADRSSDRLKASELLGRSEADFTDKIGVGALDSDGELKEIPLIFIKAQPRLLETK